MNDRLPYIDWNMIRNALVAASTITNTMTIHYYDNGVINKVVGSLFKMSDADEEIMIKNGGDFYILKYEEIHFAAVKVK